MPRKKSSWWPLARRLLLCGFIALVVWLLVSRARQIEWGEVADALRRLDAAALALAACLAAFSHLIYSLFDLLGRSYTGHRLSTPSVMTIGFTSYAFNLNLGSLIGGFAFRLRLYSRFGLKRGVIARVLSLSLVTNWLGYTALAGGLFAAGVLDLPENLKLGATGLRILGVLLLALAAAYLAACAFARKRDWHLRGARLHLPSWRMALVQLALSSLNWLTIAAVIFALLAREVDYGTVLAVLLVAAVAGVVTHIPAGLGVIEAVFLTFLAGTMPEGRLLAALLAYRGIYYLAPLAAAVVTYLLLEARAARGVSSRPVHRTAS